MTNRYLSDGVPIAFAWGMLTSQDRTEERRRAHKLASGSNNSNLTRLIAMFQRGCPNTEPGPEASDDEVFDWILLDELIVVARRRELLH